MAPRPDLNLCLCVAILLFPVQVVDVDGWSVLLIEYGICALVIPARRHVVAIIEIDGMVGFP